MVKIFLLLGLIVMYSSRFRIQVVKRIFKNGLTNLFVFVCEIMVFGAAICLILYLEEPEGLRAAIGLSVYIVGVVIATTARFQLRDNYMPAFSAQKPDSIVTNGVYSVVRNPVYLGMLLVLFGFAFTYNHLLGLLTLLSVFVFAALVRKEELLLSESNFDSWKMYKIKTRWRLVPLIW